MQTCRFKISQQHRPRTCPVPSRTSRSSVKALRTVQHTQAGLTNLESACTVQKAEIGYNQLGYRGLIASEKIQEGDIAISVPLHNVLQVPRKLGTSEAAAAAHRALDNWQQHHGKLPSELSDLILDADCLWEAKLVYWLLHLKATAQPGTLWHAYCQALPGQEETLSFFCYSEEQAEQLQFSTWKALAASQRQLLQSVQQQAAKLYKQTPFSSYDNLTSTADPSTQHEIAWALSMVKSRTFGRTLQKQQQPEQQQTRPEQQQTRAAANMQHAAHFRFHELEPRQASYSEADDTVADSRVVLLMVPFVDMINHSQQENCSFGVNWSKNCFEVTSTNRILPGSEITISYGSSKTNLALLSCYGFYIPGNCNDAQLLQPVFRSCVAIAGILGFEQETLERAVAGRLQDIQQGAREAGEDSHLMQVARVQCAAAAMPVREEVVKPVAAAGASMRNSDQRLLQLQKYLAELIKYQIQQILKLCGTSVEEDTALLVDVRSPAGHASSSIDLAIKRQTVAARLEQKLLLLECQEICRRIAGMAAE